MNFNIILSLVFVTALADTSFAIISPRLTLCMSVNCTEINPNIPKICSNGKPPEIPPNECCPRCPPDCKNVKCKATPKICIDGKPPVTLPFECCPVCSIYSTHCSNCAIMPEICPNGKPPVKSVDGCCNICPTIDCSQIKCCAPTRYCKIGEVPRPNDSTCCPICRLNCESVSCAGCGYGAKSLTTPNSCCPVCRQVLYF